ncbi:MAG TPA: hypothetical protein VF723_08980 [Pyrinomonadaceae bacterium]
MTRPSRDAGALASSVKYSLLLICLGALCAATASAQAIQSVYTDSRGKQCRTLERDDDAAGYLLQQCPGVAGYKVQVMSGDDRQNIIVVKPDGSKHELNFGQIGGGGFSDVGAKVEWRVARQRGRLVPIALIVRFNISEDSSNPQKITSYLTVTKITPRKICLIDTVHPGPNANEEARRLADGSASKPCFEVLPPPDTQ